MHSALSYYTFTGEVLLLLQPAFKLSNHTSISPACSIPHFQELPKTSVTACNQYKVFCSSIQNTILGLQYINSEVLISLFKVVKTAEYTTKLLQR